MKVSEIIRGGMKYVARSWCKGELQKDDAVCGLGATVLAAGGINDTVCGVSTYAPGRRNAVALSWAIIALHHYAEEQGYASGFGELNDASTKDQVLEAMEKVALMFEENGR